MDQLLEIAARYGTTAVVAVILFVSVMKWLGKQTISVSIGKPGSNGNGSNGGNGNGNGKLTEADVSKLISVHHNSCSSELFRKIDEYNRAQALHNETMNRALGRIEGHLEAKQ